MAVQLVMGEPLDEFIVKVTVAFLEDVARAVRIVGGSGAALDVMIKLDVADAILLPTELVQVTVKLYAVAGVKPLTAIGLEPSLTPVMGPGDEVAIQPVTFVPPFELTVKNTLTDVEDTAEAIPIVGNVGTVQVVIELVGAEEGEVPAAFVQLTVNV